MECQKSLNLVVKHEVYCEGYYTTIYAYFDEKAAITS